MEKDYGIRFTDEIYSSKEDVRKSLNMTSIDSVWNKISSYRSLYTRQLSLTNAESVPFSIVLYPSLLTKVIRIEKKLSKMMINLTKMTYSSIDQVNEYRISQLLGISKSISSSYGIDASEQTLKALILNKIEDIPVEQLIVSRYIKADIFAGSFKGTFDLSLLVRLYTILRGGEYEENVSSYFRSVSTDNHDISSSSYEGINENKITEKLNNLFSFLNDSSLPGIFKAVLAYFMINYISPFEYYNDEVAILLLKCVLSDEDNENITSLINIEYFINLNKKIISKKFNETLFSLDSTYVISYFVNLLDEIVVSNDITITERNVEVTSEESETLNMFNEHASQIISPSDMKNRNIEGVSFEKKVSMPSLPVGLDESDAQLIAHHLLEIYPSLKKAQANFYAHHCTIGKYYTISQYKNEENVAYETARTSMDNLAVLGFYRKEQIKNKFVYTPVNRK